MDQYVGLDVSLKETSISVRSTANGSGAGQVFVASKGGRRSAPKACAGCGIIATFKFLVNCVPIHTEARAPEPTLPARRRVP